MRLEALTKKTIPQEAEAKRIKPPEGLSYSLHGAVLRGVPMTPLTPSFQFEGFPYPEFTAVSPGLSLATALDTATGKALRADATPVVALTQRLSGIITLCRETTVKFEKAGNSIDTIAEHMLPVMEMLAIGTEEENEAKKAVESCKGNLIKMAQEASEVGGAVAKLNSYLQKDISPALEAVQK